MSGMLGQRLGPYTIEAELGSGGMGTVYRAQGPDGLVALKVVHPHLLATPGSFKRFLREARAGKAVRHANVVRTLDADALEIDGVVVHFLVMEHVAGKSLRQLLHELGTIPETLLREIAMQAAAGLSAIHAAGIVHRDLKPENVLISDDHEVRIMDLGVAKLQEATLELTRQGHFAGSLLYASPEQLLEGEEVGPASDLYALGVLLYELATGGNPFRRDTLADVMDAQLSYRPPSLRERNADTTEFLAELVATLLAKRPEDRCESAETLRRILEEAEGSPWWSVAAPAPRRSDGHLPRIHVRRATALHGRAEDLRALGAAWERAREGEGNSILLEGEAGIGKTRLIDAFLRGLGDTDLHVLYGSYPPSGETSGLSEAIVGKFGDGDLAGALSPYLTVTASLVPAFAARVKNESPPPGATPLSAEAVCAICVHLMRALAAERPVIWIVENLNFAPREGRDSVLALARAVESQRVLLVATARPGLAAETLVHLGHLDCFQRRSLQRLGGRDIVKLLADAFRSDALAEKLGGTIAVKSDGVPFFVLEMVRGLEEGRRIRRGEDGSYVQTRPIQGIEVPSAVKDLIDGRLEALSDNQRAILEVGAVQGMAFDPSLVARILEARKVRVLRDLAEIERRHGLVRGEARRTRFDQNQIQEVLYRDLTPDLRSEYHALLAEARAADLGEEVAGEDAAFLAHHHLRGSRPRNCVPHLLSAIEFLERSCHNDAAIDLATRALGSVGLLEAPLRVEVLLRLAGRHGVRGEPGLEHPALDEALRLADECGDPALRARVRDSLGRHFMFVSDHGAAREWLEQSLELARRAGDRKSEAAASVRLGQVCWRRGENAEARARIERALELALELGDRRAEAAATGSLVLVLDSEGLHDEALAQAGKHVSLTRMLEDRLAEATATGNLAAALCRLGRFEEARPHLEQHLALARELGDRASEGRALGNLGAVAWSQGRCAEAEQRTRGWMTLSREIGDRAGELLGAGNLTAVLCAQGRYDEARASAARQLELAREIGDRRQESLALGSHGTLASAADDPEGAIRWHTEALNLQRELGASDRAALSLVALGRVEARRGEHQASIAYLEEASRLAQENREPGALVLSAVHRARLPGGDVEAARAALREHEEHVEHFARMGCRFRLWELTGEREHLTEARRLLDFALEHAPEEHRASMLENIPLHRDIRKAWQEHGGEE